MPSSGGKAFQELHNAHVNDGVLVHVCVWWCDGVMCDGMLVCGMRVVMVCLCMCVCDGVMCVWCMWLCACMLCDGVFMCVWWCDSLHWIGTPGVGDLSPSSSAGFLGSAPSSPNVSVTTVCSVSDSYGARRIMREKRMEEADNSHQAAPQAKFGFTQHLVATVTHM